LAMSSSTIVSTLPDAGAVSVRTVERVLREGCPLLNVESPPGAGKTALVEALLVSAVGVAGLRAAVIAPHAEQTYGLLRRVVSHYGPLPLALLQSAQRELPPDLLDDQRIPRPVSEPRRLPGVGPLALVATADKLLFESAVPELGKFDLLICDEAYQLTYSKLAPLLRLTKQTVLVGDPGQLPTLVTIPVHRFETAPHRVHWAAPRELKRCLPDLPTERLPVTRRLPQDTVAFIQQPFYPNLPFSSAVYGEDCRLQFAVRGNNSVIDRALDLIAAGCSIVCLLLPGENAPAGIVDYELSEVAAEVIARFLARQPIWQGRMPLDANHVGYADAHVASGEQTAQMLRSRGVPTDKTQVLTPEIWQGLERPFMAVKHPLSGLNRLSTFDLEPGRFCVMLTRHQLGCVIVGRESIGERLAQHQHTCGERPFGAENSEWAGWQAHYVLWERLREEARLIKLSNTYY